MSDMRDGKTFVPDPNLTRLTDERSQELEHRDVVVTGGPWPEAEEDGETMIINMGPQHPSTHGVLRVMMELDAETVLRAKAVIGYLHTGMEKTGEELTYVQGSTNVTRMDYAAPLSNELVFSLATERLLDIDVPPRATWIRMYLVELNRIASHLLWQATNGLDLGALSMIVYGWREREETLPLCDTVVKGASEYDELLTGNPIWQERTAGVGVITTEQALALGVSGPILRSTGFPWDLRKAQPCLAYDDVDFDVIYTENGDCYDRYRLRLHEILESVKIVRQCVEKMPPGDYRIQDRKVTPPPRARIDESMEALIHHFKLFTEGFKVPPGETYVAVESPRGEIGCYLVSDGTGKPSRLHIRGPSFYNLQAMTPMLEERLIADAVAVISTIDPIMGEVDR